MPQDLVALQGGMRLAPLDSGADPVATLQTIVSESVTATTATATISARDKAKMQGYEGDPCGECGNYTLVRNGTCMKCNTCGGTSGCS
jgi:ribonucleoside-diphosphate reductase alpha chain